MKTHLLTIMIALHLFSVCFSVYAEDTVVLASRLWSRTKEQEFIRKDILQPFAAEHQCRVAFEFFENTPLFEHIRQQQQTGKVTTDVVIAYAADMAQWGKAEYVAPLDDVIQTWTDRTFSQGLVPMTTFEGRQYFVPIGADVYLLIANKKALPYLPDGVDIQDMTWEQFAKWALAIAEGEQEGKLAVTGVMQKMLIYQYGAVFLSYGGGFPDVNSPEALQAWDLLVTLHNAYTPKVMTYENTVIPLKLQEAWLAVTHCARVGDVYRLNPDQFVIAPAPKGPAGIGSVAGTSGLGLVKNAPHSELAQKLIEYLSRPDIQLKIAKGTGGFIPPVNEAVALLGDSPEDDVIRKALHVMENGRLAFIPPVFGSNWGEVKLLYDKAFRKLVMMDGAVDAAYLDQAQKEIDRLRQE